MTDPKGGSFPDRERTGASWYPPTVAALPPDSAEPDPHSSPFLFVYAAIGGTADDVALEADIRIDVAVTASAPADDNSKNIPLDVAAVTARLLIPYLRDQDNQLDHVVVEGNVSDPGGGRLRLVFRPLNDAVRMAYGALAARPPYNAHRCEVELSYEFAAYTPVGDRRLWDVLEMRRRSQVLLLPRVSVADDQRRPAIKINPASPVTRPVTKHPAPGPEPKLGLLRRPFIPLDRIPGDERPYAKDIVRRTERFEIVAPCNQHATLYEQEDRTSKQRHQVGCVDSLALGKAPVALFVEQGELAVPGVLRVFRSLLEQDALLVVPAAYRLGRRPDSYVADGSWTTSFSATPGQLGSTAVLQAGVVPDIPAAALVELQAKTGPQARLILPTDRCSEPPKIEWSGLDGGTIAVADASVDEAGFAVTLETVFANTPVVRQMLVGAGVSADITFTFADGSTVPSALHLTAAELAGPWPDGPIGCTLADGRLTVTNHAERPAALKGVLPTLVDGRAGPLVQAAAELAPGTSTTVAAPSATTGAVAVYELLPSASGPLPEHLIVLDDLYTMITIGVADAVFAAGVTTVDGTARMQGTDAAVSFVLETSRRQVMLALSKPIARAAADPHFVVEIQATTTGADGKPTPAPLLTHDLSAGVVLFLDEPELGLG